MERDATLRAATDAHLDFKGQLPGAEEIASRVEKAVVDAVEGVEGDRWVERTTKERKVQVGC